MKVVNGVKVSLEYEGRFEDGTVFDESKEGFPLEFVVGSGQVIAGFDAAVVDMDEGSEKEFEIEPKDGYGDINEELKKEIPKSSLPQDKEPEVGMTLVMNAPNGQKIPAKISEVTPENVIIDLNHPLAGKKLIFKIKIVKTEQAGPVSSEDGKEDALEEKSDIEDVSPKEKENENKDEGKTN